MRRLAALAIAVVLTGTACGSTVEGRAIPGDPAPSAPPSSTEPQPTTVPDGFEETPEVPIEPGTRGGEFTVAADEPPSLKPADAAYTAAALFVGSVFTSLTTLDNDLRAQPGAAERWESDAGCKQWTFELNPDGEFHNGDPVTAESFVTGWKAVAEGTASHLLTGVKGYPRVAEGLDAVDDHTLRVSLAKPDCEFPQRAAAPALAPLPDEDAPEDRPIGNGPFRVESAGSSSGVELTRWDGYAIADPAYLETVHIKFMDPAAALTGFTAGDVDWAAIRGPEARAARQRHAEDGDWISRAGPGFNGLQVPAKGPLKSADARKAISLAIDRERVSEEGLDGRYPPAATMLSEFPQLTSVRPCDACEFDPAAAKALGEKAGLDSKTNIRLYVSQYPENVQWAEVVASSVKRTLGVSVRVESLPFDKFLDKIEDGDPGLYRLGWLPDVASPGNVLGPVLSSEGVNYVGYGSDKFDRLLEAAAGTADESSRGRAYLEAEQHALNTDMPVIPINSYRQFRVVDNADFKNLRMDFWGNPDLRVISER